MNAKIFIIQLFLWFAVRAKHGIAVYAARYNSWLRIQASGGWIIGPALSFSIIGQFGFRATFTVSAALAVVWLLAWFVAIPDNFRAQAMTKAVESGKQPINFPLILAACACILFAVSNTLHTAAMPLFFIREVGLPEYAPGLSLSTKCIVELAAIFLGRKACRYLGCEKCTLSLSDKCFFYLHRNRASKDYSGDGANCCT